MEAGYPSASSPASSSPSSSTSISSSPSSSAGGAATTALPFFEPPLAAAAAPPPTLPAAAFALPPPVLLLALAGLDALSCAQGQEGRVGVSFGAGWWPGPSPGPYPPIPVPIPRAHIPPNNESGAIKVCGLRTASRLRFCPSLSAFSRSSCRRFASSILSFVATSFT